MDTPGRFRNNRRASLATAHFSVHAGTHDGTSLQLWHDVGTAVGRLGQLAGTAAKCGRPLARNRRRRPYQERREEFSRQVATTAQIARAAKAIPEWDGWRSFRIVAIVDEIADTKSFYMSPVDRQPLPAFLPGQYLTFRLRPPNSDAPVVRCYSLSDHPHEDYYRCTIKLVRPPSNRLDLPLGRGSSYFHEQVHVGDVVEARAPAGTFLLDAATSDPVVLIGAGIGITPLLSMMSATIHAGRRRSVHLLLGFRNSQRASVQRAHLESWPKNTGTCICT